MSNEQKGVNDAPDVSAKGDVAEQVTSEQQVESKSNKESVSYDSYRKVMGTLKKREAELEAERLEKQKLLDERLSAEGKKDELIDSYKRRLDDLTKKHEKAVGSFAFTTLSQAISLEATREGCINVDDLIRLSDLSQEMVGEDFQVNVDAVKDVVQKAKKERPYLFKNQAAPAKVGTPTTGQTAKDDDWKKLPLKEQAKLVFQGIKK